jgi:hypothetical protein
MSERSSTLAYYHRNRKKLVKQMATYHRKNRQKIAKRVAVYHRKNRKRILEQLRAYYYKNRNKALTYSKRYHRKHRKRALEYFREYSERLSARHRHLLKRHKHQLAPRGIKGQPMSLKAHQRKLYYIDGRERLCWYCSGENNKTGSGLDRLNNNVTYAVKNTVPACRGCNVWRGSTHSVQETRRHFKPMRDAARKENL